MGSKVTAAGMIVSAGCFSAQLQHVTTLW